MATTKNDSLAADTQVSGQGYSYYRRALAGRSLPCAFLDVDLLDENIAAIAARATHGRTLRVASKSVRCAWVLRRVFESSPVYRGIMAFHPREAAFLAGEGFDDILLGYPCWRDCDVEAVCAWIKKGKTIIFMVDLPEQIRHLGTVASKLGAVAPICIDLDMSSSFPGMYFGVRRSAVRSEAELGPLLDAVKASPGVDLRGLMGYEAQVAGLGDRNPARGLGNVLIPTMKRRSMAEYRTRRKDAVEYIRSRGFALPLVNGGGTGSIETTCEEEVITEVTTGSGFYCPTLFDYYDSFHHHPAAGYAIEIVRRPMPGMVTCNGGGYVASGGLGPDKLPKPYLPEGAELLAQEGAGEVQTPVTYEGPEKLELGDPILMRHAKAGELCERFNSLLLISKGRVTGEVPTYRGQGHCFM
jgi:D-serine deaminase-like pyridoxal phosphate-dependent protein